MKRLIPVFFLLMASCELVVDVHVPYGKPKVVVNAVLRPDSTFRVVLTHTNYILDPGYDLFQPVDEAEVVIEDGDGGTETLTHNFNGEFRSETYPQSGKKYNVKVTAAGYDAAEGETTIPHVVPIIDVKWDSTSVDTTRDFPFYTNLEFTVSFKDPPGENFYQVQLVQYSIGTYYVGENNEEMRRDTVPRTASLKLYDAGIATEDERISRFADHTFEGKTYSARFATQLQNPPGMPIQRIELRLANISKELFQYEETKELSNDVMGDPFAQPVPVYSNLSNSVGIFAGAAFDVRTWLREPKSPE